MRDIKKKIIEDSTFAPSVQNTDSQKGNGKGTTTKHKRETFICDMVVALEKKESAEKIIKGISNLHGERANVLHES